MTDRKIVLIIHNVRSAHNVGSMLRTADGLGLDSVYITGYTPYPEIAKDKRLPHERQRATKQIHKSALGAEETMRLHVEPDIENAIAGLKHKGFHIAALEQTRTSQSLLEFKQPGNIAVLVGSEVNGLDAQALSLANTILEIPMLGQKESFNVAIAAALALFELKYG